MPIASILSKFDNTLKTVNKYNDILSSIKDDYEKELKKIQEKTAKLQSSIDSSKEYIELQIQKLQLELDELTEAINKEIESIVDQANKYIDKKINELSKSATKGFCSKLGLPPESEDLVKSTMVDPVITPLKETLKITVPELPRPDITSMIPGIPNMDLINSIPTI